MPRPSVWMVQASLVHLSIGMTFGALMLWNKGLPFSGQVAFLLSPQIELVLVIGQYAIAWHLPQCAGNTLTDTVRDWRSHWPGALPLPHPSPRNNIWLKANPWFDAEVVPALQARVAKSLSA